MLYSSYIRYLSFVLDIYIYVHLYIVLIYAINPTKQSSDPYLMSSYDLV